MEQLIPIVSKTPELAEAGKAVDYVLVWDRPHCRAGYPNEVCQWIETISAEADQ